MGINCDKEGRRRQANLSVRTRLTHHDTKESKFQNKEVGFPGILKRIYDNNLFYLTCELVEIAKNDILLPPR